MSNNFHTLHEGRAPSSLTQLVKLVKLRQALWHCVAKNVLYTTDNDKYLNIPLEKKH